MMTLTYGRHTVLPGTWYLVIVDIYDFFLRRDRIGSWRHQILKLTDTANSRLVRTKSQKYSNTHKNKKLTNNSV